MVRSSAGERELVKRHAEALPWNERCERSERRHHDITGVSREIGPELAGGDLG